MRGTSTKSADLKLQVQCTNPTDIWGRAVPNVFWISLIEAFDMPTMTPTWRFFNALVFSIGLNNESKQWTTLNEDLNSYKPPKRPGMVGVSEKLTPPKAT